MEDAHITDTTSLGAGISLFSVFDGHGGNEVSEYLRCTFCETLRENENFINQKYDLALVQTFKALDERLLSDEVNEQLKQLSNAPSDKWNNPNIKGVAYSVGSTACVALITPHKIYVANLGDSRCIISKNGKPYEMSVDHTPSLKSEKKRIKAAGGFIKDQRVQGMLSVSRAFGDMIYKSNEDLSYKKQLVIPVPEIWEQPITEDIDYLFIAWDGIWECMHTIEVSNFINTQMKKISKRKRKASKMSQVIEALFMKNLADELLDSSKQYYSSFSLNQQT